MNPHPALEVFVNWLLNQSLQAGVLVLLVLFVQGVFRRQLTAHWRFALWWLVLLLLLLPFRPQSAFSLFNYCRAYVVLDGPRYPVPVASMPSVAPAATGLPLDVPPQPGFDPGAAPSEKSAEVQADPAGAQAPGTGPPTAKLAEIVTGVPGARTIDFDDLLLPGVAALWLLGALALGGCVLQQALRFQRHLARSVRPVEDAALALLEDCRRELGVRRRVELLETDAVKSPALFGLFRLRLLLPTGLTARFSREQLRFIFLHELAHVKRGDLWLNWLVTALQVMHWFNPLLWLGFARLRADRELACDELALIHIGEGGGKPYGQTIIKLLEGFSRPTVIPGLVGIVEDAKQMERRIRMIARFKKPSRRSNLAALLVLGFGLVSLTSARTQSPGVPEKLHNSFSRSEVATTEAQSEGQKASAILTNKPIATAAPPATAKVINFRVVEKATGRGLPGTSVKVWFGNRRKPDPDATHTTDGDGRCFIRLPDPLPPLVHAFSTSEGFTPLYVSWFNTPQKKELPENYTLALDPGTTVGGFARDQDGHPIAGVEFKFHYRNQGAPPLFPMWEYTFKTDAEGRWRCDFFDGNVGEVSALVSHPQYALSTQTGDHFARFKMDDLKKQQANVVLHKAGLAHGTVRDQAGKPLPDIEVVLGDQGSTGNMLLTKTDQEGRYKFDRAQSGIGFVKIEVPGYAPDLIDFEGKAAMTPIDLTLRPGLLLRGKVVDEAGQPLPDAVIRADNWRRREYTLFVALRTGREGRFVWTNAPLDEVRYMIAKFGYVAIRSMVLKAGDGEHIIKLKAMPQKGSNTPPKSRQSAPAPKPGASSEPAKDQAEPQAAADKVTTASKVSANTILNATTQVSGRGAVANSPNSSGLISGIVRFPDGRPAAGVPVALCTGRQAPMVGRGRFVDRGLGTVTNPQGHFLFKDQPEGHTVVVVHETSFAEEPVGRNPAGMEVKLQPWGRVEGTLRLGSKPGAGRDVMLINGPWYPGLKTMWLDNDAYTARTDAQGHYAIPYAPPGNRMLVVDRGQHKAPSLQSYVVVETGVTTRVNLGGTGRPVIGRFVADDPKQQINWEKQVRGARLNVKLPPAPRPQSKDLREEQLHQRDFWNTVEGQARFRRFRSFPVRISADGMFRAEDVPSGDYVLTFLLTELAANSNASESLILRHDQDVVVPDTDMPSGRNDEPLDLGMLTLRIPRNFQVGDPAPPFEVKTVDGRPLKLADFRGKYVLLEFWASWSQPCRFEWPHLKATWAAFGKDDRFAMIGLSLDRDAETARKHARTNDVTWPQGLLGEWSKTTLPNEYGVRIGGGVHSIPALFLIGPDGKIVAMQFWGESIKATVEKALAVK